MKLPSLDRLRGYEAERLISIQEMDDLIIANYTPRCTYSNAWDDATMAARGLILRTNGDQVKEIIALPFPKFFNVGEGGRYPLADLAEASEKLDGSLGILYRHNGDYRIATRGSFKSEQALWATEFLKRYDLTNLPANYTLLFEIIYPDGRIVIDYGDREDMVLLAVRDRFSGLDFPIQQVFRIGYRFGFNLPMIPYFGRWEEALDRAKELDAQQEGWVLRFADGTRFKVKGHAYRELHKLLSGVSWKAVIEALIEGRADEMLAAIPEEYREEADGWRKDAEARMRETLARVSSLLAEAPKGSRKEMALWLIAEHREDAPLVFALADGKDIVPLIFKAMLKDRVTA